MTDRSITLTYEVPAGPRKRITFHPRSDGTWRRTTAKHTGCAWRETGSEIVTDLEVDPAMPTTTTAGP